MDELLLCPMTRQLCHAFFRDYENDPALFQDVSQYRPYVYTPEEADRFFDSKQRPDRQEMVVMMGGHPIGHVQIKNIDLEKRECELGATMQNDSYKGKGYGTRIVKLALQYAFDTLGMNAVWADTVLTNTRSQHVLEKVGFRYIREDGTFKYYCYEK